MHEVTRLKDGTMDIYDGTKFIVLQWFYDRGLVIKWLPNVQSYTLYHVSPIRLTRLELAFEKVDEHNIKIILQVPIGPDRRSNQYLANVQLFNGTIRVAEYTHEIQRKCGLAFLDKVIHPLKDGSDVVAAEPDDQTEPSSTSAQMSEAMNNLHV